MIGAVGPRRDVDLVAATVGIVFEPLFDDLLPFGLLVFVGRPGPRPG